MPERRQRTRTTGTKGRIGDPGIDGPRGADLEALRTLVSGPNQRRLSFMGRTWKPRPLRQESRQGLGKQQIIDHHRDGRSDCRVAQNLGATDFGHRVGRFGQEAG